MTEFRCPLCCGALDRQERSLCCGKGHRFDLAREGYVHLLPVGQKNSLSPGDDKEMVSARRLFLEQGWYSPLRDALCALAGELTGDHPRLLDAGCGEGYYTQGLFSSLTAAGKLPEILALDISKFSVQKAARRCREIRWAVASVYRIPVADEALDMVINVFSPLAAEEFRRVLRPEGYFLYVVPAAMHLWEMKQVLYDRPYPNEEKDISYPGFICRKVVPLEFTLHLPGQQEIRALFGMTPYTWKTSREGKNRLAALDSLDCQAAFRILVFQKEE